MVPVDHPAVGNLVDDPELRFTGNGTAVANLRVAVTPRVQDGGTWRDGETSFFRVHTRRDQATYLSESLRKGDRVLVVGRLRQRSWETPGGERRSVAEVEATARVERAAVRDLGARHPGTQRQPKRGRRRCDTLARS
ncbi:MAG TPA: single-stranded DNA-binding protein [Actinomycetes bacterium]|nr:single-stranded DNA-binding protein [Actinomycetes bacterium]